MLNLANELNGLHMNTSQNKYVNHDDAKPGTFTDKFRVRVSEVDPMGLVTTRSLSNYLQEVATEHSLRLGNSLDVLFKHGITWVVSRICFRMDALPGWRDVIQVETWPVATRPELADSALAGRNSHFMLREFVFTDEEGNRLGAGTSSWSVIDLKKRSSIQIPDWIRDNAVRTDQAIQFDFPPLPAPAGKISSKDFNVRLGDLDVNRHVNYLNYISWALETMPIDSLATRRLKELDISFKAEGLYGDTIRSSTAMDVSCLSPDKNTSCDKESVTFNHSIIRVGDGKELARLRTRWLV